MIFFILFSLCFLGLVYVIYASFYEKGFDPRKNEVINRFDIIKRKTGCLFSQASKIWACPAWKKELTAEENMQIALPVLVEFLKKMGEEKLDGIVIEARPAKKYAKSVEAVADTLRRVVLVMSQEDPVGDQFMKYTPAQSPSWSWLFCGEAFFVTTFAPCYSINHPRHSYGQDSLFILLQPEISFEIHKIPAHAVKGNIRQKIRDNFASMGQAYHHKHPPHIPVASWFVRPAEIVENPEPEEDDDEEDYKWTDRNYSESQLIRWWDDQGYDPELISDDESDKKNH